MILPSSVRRVGELVAILDVIKHVTAPNCKQWMDYSRALKRYPCLSAKMVSGRGDGGGRRMILTDTDTALTVVKITLARKRFSADRVKEILVGLGVSSEFYITGLVTPESEWVGVMQASFRDFKSLTQHPCGKFNIDLYFPGANVAVECDEDGHKWVKGDYEREKFITGELGCRWVRFNPFCDGMGGVIYNLRKELLC